MPEKWNILQIDVEDWYSDLENAHGKSYQDRIVNSTVKLLSILREKKTRATFFVLGHIAERFPELIKEIQSEKHEVASHGYAHIPITKQSQSEFEQDLLKSVRTLEDITGEKVLGYRAPRFSVVEKTLWAINIIKNNGLMYDSSIFPAKTHLYGIPDSPPFPYPISSLRIENDDSGKSFLEIPLSVYRIPYMKINIPIAGGFFLRFFPYGFISYAISQINKSNHPAVCYLHPWELDPEQPRIRSLPWYHYYQLNGMEKKFRRLLGDFQFTSVRDYFKLV